ncbi:MAG TPA: hypothetical protein DCQ31_04490 [Bacteroidales bacterium]|nr:hypothetical protein [Bacteroidales bacterium]
MEANKISVEDALNLIKAGEFNPEVEVNFTEAKIDVIDAVLLGKNGIDVPEELIEYDDDKIDYSDIPAITDEDIESGKIVWIRNAQIPVRKEIDDWIKAEKIDFNTLITELVENFYKTMKNIQKNAAL